MSRAKCNPESLGKPGQKFLHERRPLLLGESVPVREGLPAQLVALNRETRRRGARRVSPHPDRSATPATESIESIRGAAAPALGRCPDEEDPNRRQ